MGCGASTGNAIFEATSWCYRNVLRMRVRVITHVEFHGEPLVLSVHRRTFMVRVPTELATCVRDGSVVPWYGSRTIRYVE